MTTIDHRILIPAAPDVVWDYISDITRNPDWQIDCRDVVFLTSRREGPGVRWRYTTPGGDRVIAVTAWYNGLGYEYYFVDGVSFKENKGRLRLQEIPEGTIVQWTFHYELGGLFGGMRNALGVSRQVDHTIAESLKTLWQKIKQSGAAAKSHEAKSLMRDAPDVNARSAYQPRHPSVMDEVEKSAQPAPAKSRLESEPPISVDDGQPIHVIAEPPIAEDDTRPRRPVTPPTAEVASVPPDDEDEPEFLTHLEDFSRFEPPRDLSDTQPRIVEAPPEVTASAEPIVAPPPGEETEPLPAQPPLLVEPEKPEPEPEARLEEPTAPAARIDLVPEAPPAADEQPTQPPLSAARVYDVPEREQAAPLPPPPTPAPAPEPEAPPEPPTEPKVTREAASIWEIFGVPRPSETQEAAALKVEPPSPEPALESDVEAEAVPVRIKLPLASTHVGLRIALRRKLIRLRRP